MLDREEEETPTIEPGYVQIYEILPAEIVVAPRDNALFETVADRTREVVMCLVAMGL